MFCFFFLQGNCVQQMCDPFFSSLKVKVNIAQSCPTLCDPHGLHSPWNSPGQNTEVGSLSLLQEIFPTQE